MRDQLIEFKTAKLAKEKGFTEECYALWQKILIEGEKNDNIINEKGIYAAPTQSLLQRWLREEHGILVESLYSYSAIDYIPKIGKLNAYQDYNLFEEISCNTYELALEQGLIEALKLIK